MEVSYQAPVNSKENLCQQGANESETKHFFGTGAENSFMECEKFINY